MIGETTPVPHVSIKLGVVVCPLTEIEYFKVAMMSLVKNRSYIVESISIGAFHSFSRKRHCWSGRGNEQGDGYDERNHCYTNDSFRDVREIER